MKIKVFAFGAFVGCWELSTFMTLIVNEQILIEGVYRLNVRQLVPTVAENVVI